MPTLQVYLDEETRERLAIAAKELGRTVVSLAEAAISEAAATYHHSNQRARSAARKARR